MTVTIEQRVLAAIEMLDDVCPEFGGHTGFFLGLLEQNKREVTEADIATALQETIDRYSGRLQ